MKNTIKTIITLSLVVIIIIIISLIVGGTFLIKANNVSPISENISSNIPPISEPFFKEIVYGYSALGKEVKGYEIGKGQKYILIFGSIHGNEMGSHDLLERLAIEIKQYPEKVSEDIKLIIIPVLNPDGLYDRTDKLNGNGVNLDLNFETTTWEEYGPEGTYAGPAPFSEPESKIIRDIVEKNNVKEMVSFHSMGGLVIPENNQPSMDLAKRYAEQTGYTYTGPDAIEYFGYSYFGTPTEWFSEKTGNIGITIELTNHYNSDWDKNKNALMGLISNYKEL